MGRKRKATTTSKEVNTQMAREDEVRAPANGKANVKQATSVGKSVHQDSIILPTKEKTLTPAIVETRRSARAKKSVSYTFGSPKVKRVVEHVNVIESESKEAEESHQGSPSPAVTEKILEQEAPKTQELNTVLPVDEVDEKVCGISQTVDELKSLATESQDEEQCCELSYKSLYIESQKKIAEMMENHFELVRKLDFAQGKVEAYEKMMGAFVANQGKPTEAEVSLSPQCLSPVVAADKKAAKRKKKN